MGFWLAASQPGLVDACVRACSHACMHACTLRLQAACCTHGPGHLGDASSDRGALILSGNTLAWPCTPCRSRARGHGSRMARPWSRPCTCVRMHMHAHDGMSTCSRPCTAQPHGTAPSLARHQQAARCSSRCRASPQSRSSSWSAAAPSSASHVRPPARASAGCACVFIRTKRRAARGDAGAWQRGDGLNGGVD